MKEDLEILVMQLHSTQMSMQASMAQSDIVLRQLRGVLAAMEDVPETAPAPSSTSAAPSPPTSTNCPHPTEHRDLSVRVMGHPRRFKCRKCNEVVDPDAGESLEGSPSS